MSKVPAIHSWYDFTVEHVSEPVIRTKSEQIADGCHEHHTCDVRIDYEVGISDSCSGTVFVELYDTGHEDDEGNTLYDMGFVTGNGDNWGMVTSARAVQVVLEKHFQLDLHLKFRMIGEDYDDEVKADEIANRLPVQDPDG